MLAIKQGKCRSSDNIKHIVLSLYDAEKIWKVKSLLCTKKGSIEKSSTFAKQYTPKNSKRFIFKFFK